MFFGKPPNPQLLPGLLPPKIDLIGLHRILKRRSRIWIPAGIQPCELPSILPLHLYIILHTAISNTILSSNGDPSPMGLSRDQYSLVKPIQPEQNDVTAKSGIAVGPFREFPRIEIGRLGTTVSRLSILVGKWGDIISKYALSGDSRTLEDADNYWNEAFAMESLLVHCQRLAEGNAPTLKLVWALLFQRVGIDTSR